MEEKQYKLEKAFQSDAIKHLKGLGYFVFKCESQTRGIPDVFLLKSGVHIFIELKLPKGQSSKIQQLMIDRINSNGGNAFVAYSMADINRIIKECSNE